MAIERHPHRLRRVAASSLAALLLPIATACADDPTRAGTDPGIGQVERTETMKALGLALVTNENGAARLVGTLVNTGAERDRLVGLDLATTRPFEVRVGDAPVVLPPDQPVQLVRDAEMILFTDDLRPGFRQDLTLVFRGSAPIETTVPVETATGPYAEVEVLGPQDGDISPD